MILIAMDNDQYEVDDELLREERQEALARAVRFLGSPYKVERQRLARLEDMYMLDCLTLTFWRLQSNAWQPGMVTRLECLRRLETLLESDDASVRYEAQCDIEARLYQGQRIWQ